MDTLFDLILAMALWIGILLVPWAGIWYAVYYLLSLPLRRQERARIFLELLLHGLAQGKPAAQVIRETAQCRDRILGKPYVRMASQMPLDASLAESLACCYPVLPRQIIAILGTGAELGNLDSVLPAARNLLRDPESRFAGAVNYAVLILAWTGPAFLIIFSMIRYFVIPKMIAIAADLQANFSGTFFLWMLDNADLVLGLAAMVFAAVLVPVILYLGGEGIWAILGRRGRQVMDWISLALPWIHRRLQRDFSRMLAILLDAGVPEGRAVLQAGECTGNAVMIRRAHRVKEALEAGEPLREAIRFLDDAGELRWRLTNAAAGPRGFLRSLEGWHEFLDAKAYQQEQATAHFVTTGLVLLNGFVAGSLAIGMFSFLTTIIQAAS